MVEKEAIMICIDNSRWMNVISNRLNYYLQLKCVRSYCRAKLKANPDNALGIVTMGIEHFDYELQPTSDLDKILNRLKSIWTVNAGDLNLSRGILTSINNLMCIRDPSSQKKILIFTGGPTKSGYSGPWYEGLLKHEGIGVDVINFCLKDYDERVTWQHEECNWVRKLNAFVAAVNNNNNGHIIHIEPNIWTHSGHILSSNPDIVCGALLEKEEIMCLEANKPPNPYYYDGEALVCDRAYATSKLRTREIVTGAHKSNPTVMSPSSSLKKGESARKKKVNDVKKQNKNQDVSANDDDDDDLEAFKSTLSPPDQDVSANDDDDLEAFKSTLSPPDQDVSANDDDDLEAFKSTLSPPDNEKGKKVDNGRWLMLHPCWLLNCIVDAYLLCGCLVAIYLYIFGR